MSWKVCKGCGREFYRYKPIGFIHLCSICELDAFRKTNRCPEIIEIENDGEWERTTGCKRPFGHDGKCEPYMIEDDEEDADEGRD